MNQSNQSGKGNSLNSLTRRILLSAVVGGLICGLPSAALGSLMGNMPKWVTFGIVLGAAVGAIVEFVFTKFLDGRWIYRRRLIVILVVAWALFFLVQVPYFESERFLGSQRGPVCCETPADYGLTYRNVTFQGGDGLKLAGWYLPGKNRAGVILLHGDGGNRLAMMFHAETLAKAGYSVLMYDERALGESEGTTRSYGWLDTRDVPGAVDFILAQGDVDRVGIMGCSLGAQIAVRAAAREPRISAVLGDGTAITVYQDLPPDPVSDTDRATRPWIWLTDRMFELRLGTTGDISTREALLKIAPRPLLLIAGQQNELETKVNQYWSQLVGKNAELWVIEEAGHCGGPAAVPDQYRTRLVGFFDAALLR